MARFTRVTTIKEEIEKFLSKDPLYIIVKNWENIVGKTIKKFSFPLKLQDKILVIGVTNHAWLQEMILSQNKILENIKKLTIKVTKIKILLNIDILKALNQDENKENKTKKVEKKLNRQEEILVEIISSKVQDNELREVIKKVMTQKISF